MDLPFPPPPPTEEPAADADGNTRTFAAWAKANAFVELLDACFPTRHPGVEWGFEAFEREFYIGDWPDADIESYAVISIGMLFDPQDTTARAFADFARAQAPRSWRDSDVRRWSEADDA